MSSMTMRMPDGKQVLIKQSAHVSPAAKARSTRTAAVPSRRSGLLCDLDPGCLAQL